MLLVDEIFKPKRIRVVTKSNDGKMANSNGFRMFIVINKITRDIDKLNIIIISRAKGGSGISNSNTIATTKKEIALFNIRFIFVYPFFPFN